MNASGQHDSVWTWNDNQTSHKLSPQLVTPGTGSVKPVRREDLRGLLSFKCHNNVEYEPDLGVDHPYNSVMSLYFLPLYRN